MALLVSAGMVARLCVGVAVVAPLIWLGSLPVASRPAPARAKAAPAVPLAYGLPVKAVGAVGARTLADVLGRRATVLVFVGTECPISNRYAPAIADLGRAYAAQGVRVVLVYSNAHTTAESASKHQAEYKLSDLPAVLDTDQTLADIVGATVTPQAFVLDAGRVVRYAGRIDNANADRGIARNAPATNDLRDALDATLAGNPVASANTRAVGCAIERRESAANNKNAPTYARDIAPLLNANCVSCHRDGEVGPMPLATYEDARRYAANIAAVTGAKQMPPWKPAPGCGPFEDERRLTDRQIATIKAWAGAGAPPGKKSDLPAAPSFPKGWTRGTPDLVLTVPTLWHVGASGADLYRCFVLPTGLTEDKQVVAIEYRAGNKSVVHHCLGYIDTSGQARLRDGKDGLPGYTSFGGPGFKTYGELGGWAPGNAPQFLPPGIARPLPKGSDVVVQIHYHPDGKPEDDQTKIGLYFARAPITKKLRSIPIASRVDIPAGEGAYHTSQTYPVPFDADIISVMPHMHWLGRNISLTATLPDGTKQTLVRVDDWDFNWQGTYTFKQAVHLPHGSKITLEATFDNSPANPRNPNSPPQRVHWGEKTTDEMCLGYVNFTVTDENNPVLRMLEGRGGAATR